MRDDSERRSKKGRRGNNLSLEYPPVLQSYSYIDRILIPKHRMSTTTNSTKLSQRTLDFRQKYKTQRCRYWYERGFCPFNQMCAFAHADHELRGRTAINHHYKTKLCTNFRDTGYCKYGGRCQFLHLHEAPASSSTHTRPTRPISDTLSERPSPPSADPEGKRHQKELSLLGDYGLEVLAIKKGRRSQQWRSFLTDGVDPYEAESFNWEDFEQQCADYDFRRKPRLGSM